MKKTNVELSSRTSASQSNVQHRMEEKETPPAEVPVRRLSPRLERLMIARARNRRRGLGGMRG